MIPVFILTGVAGLLLAVLSPSWFLLLLI